MAYLLYVKHIGRRVGEGEFSSEKPTPHVVLFDPPRRVQKEGTRASGGAAMSIFNSWPASTPSII